MSETLPTEEGTVVERSVLYSRLADWWPLLSPPEDYVEEAQIYSCILRDSCEVEPRTLLELGAGGGNNASHLKAHFQVTLTDISPAMLDVSRALNPECEHLVGDMRTLRLARHFDAVLVQDAVCHMRTAEDLRRTIETAAVHCAPGGAALFCPDYVRENFTPGAECGGQDGSGRAMRYLEWRHDPDPEDESYITDMVYALRDRDGGLRVEHESWIMGLFSRTRWLTLIGEAGFEPRGVPFRHSSLPADTHEVFVGLKRRS